MNSVEDINLLLLAASRLGFDNCYLLDNILRDVDGNIIEINDDLLSQVSAIKLENAQKNFIEKRNFLLKESDWTQLDDVPVNKNDWIVYRQALRDLPENTQNFENPVWPTPPSN